MSGRDDETPATGEASAKLVEKAYVDLQKTFREYRLAGDVGGPSPSIRVGGKQITPEDPTVVLQDAVMSTVDLITPYVHNDPRVAEYWEGAIASYPPRRFASTEEAKSYYLRESIGVWQVQAHPTAVRPATAPGAASATEAATDGGSPPQTAKGWHERLSLPRTTRVLTFDLRSEHPDFEEHYLSEGRMSVIGLRDVADWQFAEREIEEEGDGFMAGETASRTVLSAEPAKKVETAARMLFELLDELGAIAGFEPQGERVRTTPRPPEEEG